MNQAAQPGPGDSWDRYWSEGHRHACPTSFTGFYGEATQAFWKARCGVLRREDRLLELGCGNGGLLTFLQSCWPAGEGPELHGVDAAAIDPAIAEATAVEPDRIRIHGGSRFEAVPLPDASVTMVVSQFGVEYGNTDATWSELLRVAAPAAGVAFVLHQRGSRLDEVAADEVLITRAALVKDGVLPCAANLLPFLLDSGTEAGRAALERNPRALAARDRYNAATQALLDVAGMLRHGGAGEELLSTVAEVLSRAPSRALSQSRDLLEVVKGKVSDNLQRLEALRRSALDAEGVAAIASRLEAGGFTMEAPDTIVEEGHAMGWCLYGSRAGGHR